MTRDGPIQSVIVAGGGIVGWSAAAMLRRSFPHLSVTLLASDPPAGAIADRWPAALPSIRAFHARLRIGDEDAVTRAGNAWRLGTRFTGWQGPETSFVHGYGDLGSGLNGAAFHLQWLRAADLPLDAFSPAVALAAAGFAAPNSGPGSPLGGAGHGLTLDPDRYPAMLRAYARHVGVVERTGTVRAVLIADDGFVDALDTDTGERLTADLFVDATGSAALIRGRLDREWVDWADAFPCDRLLLAGAPAAAAPALLDDVMAMSGGWRWRAHGQGRTALACAYAAEGLGDDAAAASLAEAGATDIASPADLRPGARPRPWAANCVAIGDAAAVLDPIDHAPLHLAHAAIERLVSMWPDRGCDAVEIADYNRQAFPEAERLRDFAALHYHLARRPEPFWRAAAAAPVPASLAHTLEQFRERGRLPFYEEETFARASWLAVLIGAGVRPRRIDPLAEATPPDAAAAALRHQAAAIALAVRDLSAHPAARTGS